MYDTMILLHIRTNYYFCWWYWYARRLLTRIYRIISSRRVVLLYFCVVYFHETYILKPFIEQRHVYGTTVSLHIRTNYYYCWWYWYTRRLLTSIYRIILSRRVALVYFCAKYFHETYIFMRFIEQKLVWYYDSITY